MTDSVPVPVKGQLETTKFTDTDIVNKELYLVYN